MRETETERQRERETDRQTERREEKRREGKETERNRWLLLLLLLFLGFKADQGDVSLNIGKYRE